MYYHNITIKYTLVNMQGAALLELDLFLVLLARFYSFRSNKKKISLKYYHYYLFNSKLTQSPVKFGLSGTTSKSNLSI